MSQKNPRRSRKTRPGALYSSPPPKPPNDDFLHGTIVKSASFELREDGTIAAQPEPRNTQHATPELIFHDPNGRIRLYHGNSLDLLDAIIKKHPDGYFDCIFADPPYFLSNGGITCHAGRMVKVDKGDWDKSQGPELNHEFNRAWLERCQRVLKPNGTIWVTGTHHVIFSVGYAMQQLGYKILNDIAWEKPNPPPNLSCRYFTHSTETIIWAAKNDKSKHVFNYAQMKAVTGKQMKTVWRGFQDEDGRLFIDDGKEPDAGGANQAAFGVHPSGCSQQQATDTLKRGHHTPNALGVHPLGCSQEQEADTLKRGHHTPIEPGAVWTLPAPGRDEKQHGKHPTQKPITLIERCLLASTHEGDRVLDPFMGAGTTAVACIQLQREFVGIELDAQHFALAQKRADHEAVQIWLRTFRVAIRISVASGGRAGTPLPAEGRAVLRRRPDPYHRPDDDIWAATQHRPTNKNDKTASDSAHQPSAHDHHQQFVQNDLDLFARSMDRIRWMEDTPPKTDCIFHEVKFVFLSCAQVSEASVVHTTVDVNLQEAWAKTPTGKKRETTHVVRCETEILRVSS